MDERGSHLKPIVLSTLCSTGTFRTLQRPGIHRERLLSASVKSPKRSKTDASLIPIPIPCGFPTREGLNRDSLPFASFGIRRGIFHRDYQTYLIPAS
jgi:hypothetical protein